MAALEVQNTPCGRLVEEKWGFPLRLSLFTKTDSHEVHNAQTAPSIARLRNWASDHIRSEPSFRFWTEERNRSCTWHFPGPLSSHMVACFYFPVRTAPPACTSVFPILCHTMSTWLHKVSRLNYPVYDIVAFL